VAPQSIDANQHMELWSGGGRLRRCDTVTCTKTENGTDTDVPCLCDPDDRECAPHTGVDFFLYEIPGLGVWRLWSTGWNFALEMGAMVPMLQGSGAQVELKMDRRHSKREGSARKDFTVPVIAANITVGMLRAGRGARAALPLPSLASPTGLGMGGGGGGISVPGLKVGEGPEAEGTEVAVPMPDELAPLIPKDDTVAEDGKPGWMKDLLGRVVVDRSEAEGQVREHLAAVPAADATMDTNEVWLRRLFRLMEPWWPTGTQGENAGKDALHMALFKRYRFSHLGQLRAKELRSFLDVSAEKAREKLDE
jgi:hypothetical protein